MPQAGGVFGVSVAWLLFKTRLLLPLPLPPCSVDRECFSSRCTCLARNTECDDRCACSAEAGCLNRSVTRRQTLRLGEDAEEVDSWGMDCYVRRNIMDGGQRERGWLAVSGAAPAVVAAAAAAWMQGRPTVLGWISRH